MKDKRSSQMTIPLGIEPSKAKGYVLQSYRLTFAKATKVSVVAKRIIAKVFEQVKENDLHFKSFYRVHISEVVPNDTDMTSAYKTVKVAFDDLLKQIWWFEDEKSDKRIPKQLFTTERREGQQFDVGYDRGWITVVINKDLEPYLVGLINQFSIVDLKNYMTFKSWYSMQMYEKLSHWKDKGVWSVSVEDFRRQMDCVDKYPETKDLVKYTLAEPTKELASTDMAFDYVLQRPDKNFGSGRKPIKNILFKLKKVEPRSIPDSWKDFSPEYTAVLDKLVKYKVKEGNIVKYAKAIGIDQIKKLLSDWDEKERSNKRIDNKEKYCNKVWIEIGKKVAVKQTVVIDEKIPSHSDTIEDKQELIYDLNPVESVKEEKALSKEDLKEWVSFYDISREKTEKTFEQFMAKHKFVYHNNEWIKHESL